MLLKKKKFNILLEEIDKKFHLNYKNRIWWNQLFSNAINVFEEISSDKYIE